MATQKQQEAAKENIKKAQKKWQEMSGVNPFDQTSVQVKLCYSESRPPQIR